MNAEARTLIVIPTYNEAENRVLLVDAIGRPFVHPAREEAMHDG